MRNRGKRGAMRGSRNLPRNRGGYRRPPTSYQPSYPVSPVRGDIDDMEEEILDKFELLKRLKEAKNSDNVSFLINFVSLYIIY